MLKTSTYTRTKTATRADVKRSWHIRIR